MLAVKEIRPGLVLFLDPETLLALSACCDASLNHLVRTPHYFLCFQRNDTHGVWAPCSTKPAENREPIAQCEKRGHTHWKQGTSYCDIRQDWLIPHSVAVAAATTARDASQRGIRNAVTSAGLARLLAIQLT